MASPRISPSRLRTLLARASRTERPLYPMAGWDAPAAAPSRASPPAAPFNQWTPRLRLIRDRPAPKPKPPRERKRRSDAANKAALREWLARHLKGEPSTWKLFRAADILVPAELLLPTPVTLSVVSYMLGDGGFTCHEAANLKDPAACRRLWSPARYAKQMGRLSAGERATLYAAQCADRLRAAGRDSPAAADRHQAPRTRPAHHGAP
jgi:hypothetical protein